MSTMLHALFIALTLNWYLVSAQDLATCTYKGVVYNEGDNITGDPCDLCQCSRYGLMCQLLHCDAALCVDKYRPEGGCCEVCPNNEITCLYDGHLGAAIVPETGCKYTENMDCYCYYANDDPAQMRTYCLPPLPFFAHLHLKGLPRCNSTDSNLRLV